MPAAPPVPLAAVAPLPASVDDLVRLVTGHLRATPEAAGGWRAAVDGLRPLTAALWAGLPATERRTLLAGPVRRWEVLRHRMAPDVADAVDRLRGSGRLLVQRAEVLSAVKKQLGWQVTLRRDDAVEHLAVAAVVNCTGPSCDITRYPGGLGLRLLDAGLAVADELGLGVQTTDDGAVVDATGRAGGLLWTLGALRRGSIFESTAMPELRAQAATMAEQLAERCANVSPLRRDRHEPSSVASSPLLRASAGRA